MGRITGLLFVNFVLCLICFIAYSSQIFVIWPWYKREVSVELLTLLIPFNVLVGLLLWNYYLCIITDPGTVPESWRPDTHTEGYEVKKLTGSPRYCRMCQKYKPPRSHHCKQCNRCVLRMDHHCPWINNCVGHFNHGHFIRFLFYVDIACSYHLMMVTRRVLDAMNSPYWDGPSNTEFIFIILNYVTSAPVLLAVGGFSIYHFNALLGNTTTIERWEKDKAATMVRKGKISEVRFPYDLGRRRNINSVLGKRPLMWCCPTRPLGSGLKYELSTRDGVAAVWPPRDPDTYKPENYDHLETSSPWTYGHDTLNPTLQPTSSSRRRTGAKSRDSCIPVTHDRVPPYHPDYDKGESYPTGDDDSDSQVNSDDDVEGDDVPLGTMYGQSDVRMRRGSEGYEVRPVSREQMLRQYLESVGEDYDRYIRYIPQPESESDEEVDDAPVEAAPAM
ncbi:palmitoyltransferase PFA4 [Macrolepiota fuliginosa MF-IS2]|uniref:Palmitoyltransferase PFA4 n=1 Tax=Macrolepiota fuliginosa MF-IS2 TaxID=1400762 RepID=A0A9P6CAK9_9AGAR|nr:palmitoyltransferase PFA4 [Macrolepiota fuliginosa MF-IS2]